MRFEIVSYEELPQSLRDTHYSNTFNSFEYFSFLLVYDKEEIIFHVSDKMEPEDTTFTRDLSWIERLLKIVKEEGYKEGHEYGLADGYDDGYDAGYEEGFAANNDDGKTDTP